jgi:transposase InsO family protein
MYMFAFQAKKLVKSVSDETEVSDLQGTLAGRSRESASLTLTSKAVVGYGAPRVFLDLREAGETCSKHRVVRLMRQNNLRALHGYRTRRLTVSNPSVLMPNILQRQFSVTRPNKAWVTDITYIRTWEGRPSGGRNGSVLTKNCRLVGEFDDSPRSRTRCHHHGRASQTAAPDLDPLGSGNAIRQ